MFPTEWAIMARLVLVGSLLGAGMGALGHGTAAAQDTGPDQPSQDPTAATRSLERTDLVKVASPVEGVVWFIATEIKPGDQVPPAQVISVTIGKETKQYRRLRKGDRVEEGQLLARIDDRLARTKYALQCKKAKDAEAAYKESLAIQDEYKARWAAVVKRFGGEVFVGSNQQERDAFRQWKTAKDEAERNRKTFEGAKLRLEKLKTILDLHKIRCRTSGVIEAIAKHPGEAVKKLETVVVVRIAKK